jgi:hypothetical protein
MFRQPLWDIQFVDSNRLGSFQSEGIPVLDIHELAAGKLAALLSRRQARDLFDCHRILNLNKLETERLRIAFVTYGGMNRKDWRTVSVKDVGSDAAALARSLIPILHLRETMEGRSPFKYGERLVRECCERLSAVLPFTNSEREFLNLLLDQGEIEPGFLTADRLLQQRIRSHPLLKWKSLNVKRHKGLP